jgi:hypothetical protein
VKTRPERRNRESTRAFESLSRLAYRLGARGRHRREVTGSKKARGFPAFLINFPETAMGQAIRRKILVVEDEPDVRSPAAALIEEMDAEVVEKDSPMRRWDSSRTMPMES